ncbi:MAG: ArsR/SmtB family transcription factor [Gammaproteobacteria bacterium]
MQADLATFTGVMKAAADPSRLRLLVVCAQGEFTVSELTRILGQSQPRVSRHLRTLCNAGLVLRFRERHFVFYRVPARGAVRKLIVALLDGLDPDDATLRQDELATSNVRGERDRRAQEVMAASYPSDSVEPFAKRQISENICAHIDLASLGDLLDIGTGTGRILKLLAPHARSAVGIDISSDMLTVARSNMDAAGLGSVMIRHGDMYRLPYPEDTFHTVTVDSVLSHAESPARALSEAARILRPNGQLLVIEVATEIGESGAVTSDRLRDWVASSGLRLDRSVNVGTEDLGVDLYFIQNADDAVAA